MIASPAEILIPAPLPHQEPIADSDARFKVVRAGRRGGKTVLAESCAVVGHGPVDGVTGEPIYKGIVHDLDVIWVARDYTQAGIMWHEFIRPRFKGVPGVRVNEADRTVTIEGAGTLFVISAENIASARGMGKRLAGVVVEEAAWLDLQTALRDVLLPALMDNEGWLLLISTTNAGPDGNPQKEVPSYFNRICEEIRAGERSDEWAEFHFTALDNPKITARAFQSLVDEYVPGSISLEQEVHAKLLRAGVGLALDQVAEDKHLVPRFPVPRHWTQFGAFDWGFNHPYVFAWLAADTDGNIVCVDTVWGRKEQPDEIAAKVSASLPTGNFRYTVAGHDCWQDRRARGENVPTIAEQFAKHGIRMKRASIARKAGLNNFRAYVQWQATEHTPERAPRFTLMDTPGNRRALQCLTTMQLDPKDLEDALKMDAQEGTGKDGFPVGGDDAYDCLRYGLASRPILAKAPEEDDVNEHTVSPELHRQHAEEMRKVRPAFVKHLRAQRPSDPDFGEF